MVQLTTDASYDGKVNFEVTLDDTTWTSVSLYPAFPDGNPPVSNFTGTATAQTLYFTLPVGGIHQFRVIGDGTTGTAGNLTVFLTAGQGQYTVFNYSDNYANFLATAKISDGVNTAAVTAANALKVDGSAVTQPVSGTVTADQGGAWTVSISGDVNVTNSGTFAVQVTNTPTVTANAGTGTFTVAGNLTHNSAIPAGNNIGVLAGLANAAAPTYAEGDQVLLSTDLAGNLRTTTTISGTTVVAGNKTNNNAAPSTDNVGVLPAIAAGGTFDAPTPQAYTAGDLVLPAVSKGGSSAVIPA
ncbi:MAG: hypothetical protein ACRETD_13790, partial [Steroidobacteraceae bacterium]